MKFCFLLILIYMNGYVHQSVGFQGSEVCKTLANFESVYSAQHTKVPWVTFCLLHSIWFISRTNDTESIQLKKKKKNFPTGYCVFVVQSPYS